MPVRAEEYKIQWHKGVRGNNGAGKAKQGMGWEGRVEEGTLGLVPNTNNPLKRLHGNLIRPSFLRYIIHTCKNNLIGVTH